MSKLTIVKKYSFQLIIFYCLIGVCYVVVTSLFGSDFTMLKNPDMTLFEGKEMYLFLFRFSVVVLMLMHLKEKYEILIEQKKLTKQGMRKYIGGIFILYMLFELLRLI